VDATAPRGAIYLSARVDLPGQTNEDIRRFLLQEAGVAVVPFQAFGYPEDDGWMRLSIGAVSVAQCEEAIAGIGRALSSRG
jgi:aspartate aminotransferase